EHAGERRRDIDRLDRKRMLESGHALAPEQDRDAAVIIPEAAMRGGIAIAGAGDRRDAGLERDHQLARTLGIVGGAGALEQRPSLGRALRAGRRLDLRAGEHGLYLRMRGEDADGLGLDAGALR